MQRTATLLAIASVLALTPALATAADFTVTASNAYVWEQQAVVFTKKPVINVDSTWDLSHGLSADVWAQYGDKDGRELDVSVAKEWQVQSGTVTVSTGGYFTAYAPVYFAEVGTSMPLGPVSLDLGAARYTGSYQSVMVSAALTAVLPITSRFKPSLTAGIAHNSERHAANWFGRVAVPIGNPDRGISLGVRGFCDFDGCRQRHFAVDISKSF